MKNKALQSLIISLIAILPARDLVRGSDATSTDRQDTGALFQIVDEDGNTFRLGDARASLLAGLKRDLSSLESQLTHLSAVTWAIDGEGLERPSWIGAELRSIDMQIARLDTQASNISLDADGLTRRHLRDVRSTVRRLTAPPARCEQPGDLTVTTTGIDAGPATGGTITGTVVDAATGRALQDILLTAYTKGDLVTAKKTRTDAAGAYALGGLAAGAYFVEAFDPAPSPIYAPEVYQDVPTHAIRAGMPVVVKAGRTTSGIDFGLDRGGRITGTVVDAATRAPLSGVYALLYVPRFGKVSGYGIVFRVDAQGKFDTRTMAGALTPGLEYRMWLNAPPGYVDEGYDNIFGRPGPEYKRLTPIILRPGQTKNLEVDLSVDSQTAYISGVVTDRATSTPLPGVEIQVSDTVSGLPMGAATTDAAGFYRAGPFWAGAYGLMALPDFSTGYAYQVYENRGWGAYFTPVSGIPEREVGNIDFALDRWGGIEGKVSDQVTHRPLEGIIVNVIYDPEPSLAPYYIPTGTGADGRFVFYTLNPQDGYRVYSENGIERGYVDEMYKNIPCDDAGCGPDNPNWDWTVGAPITVRSGPPPTKNINFALSKR